MRVAYRIAGVFVALGALVFWLASESVGGLLVFVACLAATALDFYVYAAGRTSSTELPVEQQTTSESSDPPAPKQD